MYECILKLNGRLKILFKKRYQCLLIFGVFCIVLLINYMQLYCSFFLIFLYVGKCYECEYVIFIENCIQLCVCDLGEVNNDNMYFLLEKN